MVCLEYRKPIVSIDDIYFCFLFNLIKTFLSAVHVLIWSPLHSIHIFFFRRFFHSCTHGAIISQQTKSLNAIPSEQDSGYWNKKCYYCLRSDPTYRFWNIFILTFFLGFYTNSIWRVKVILDKNSSLFASRFAFCSSFCYHVPNVLVIRQNVVWYHLIFLHLGDMQRCLASKVIIYVLAFFCIVNKFLFLLIIFIKQKIFWLLKKLTKYMQCTLYT